MLVRSVRAGGDTKTRKSRRGIELAQRAMIALRVLWNAQACSHGLMSDCTCLVIVTRTGTPMGARNVQRDFRKVMDAAGLVGKEWTPRELRQSFASLLSDERVPLEVISRVVGHRSTTVTETVYRMQLRLVIEGGPTPWTGSSHPQPTQDRSHPVSHPRGDSTNRGPVTYI